MADCQVADLTAPFGPLVERIVAEGTVVNDQILKVDHFLNHQIDPKFMTLLGCELANRIATFRPDLILTAEASGIAPALSAATALNIPLVYAKKYAMDAEVSGHSRVVPSATRGTSYQLAVSKCYLSPGKRVALIDDFLAKGRTAAALAEIVAEAGAEVVVGGFVCEKLFQRGREGLEARKIPVVALAQIERLEDGKIIMA